MKRFLRVAAVIFVLAAPFIFFWLFKGEAKRLPYLGNHDVIAPGDTQYHAVGAFSFTDQFGRTVTEQTFDSCIYVASYFFATCPSICPMVNNRLGDVVKKYMGDPEIKFISHTVNPQHDSVPVLLDYANRYKAPKDQWYFVTGNKKEIYDAAYNYYLVNAVEAENKGDFIHSTVLVLVDKEKHVRGLYQAYNPPPADPQHVPEGYDPLAADNEIKRLIEEIKVLKAQYGTQHAFPKR